MRSITIVGAGHAGLQLAVGLVDRGYDVTVVANRTPEQILTGRVTSSQCMFATAMSRERSLGLDLWEQQTPSIDGISLAVPDGQGGKAIDWASRLDVPARSVDQRLKMPAWMAEFERRGGKLVYTDATVDDLEVYARESDLVVVAAGKGEVSALFPRDAARSAHDGPLRVLGLAYVTGMLPREEYSTAAFNLVPGVGEFFTFPALTTTGVCDILVFEGVPGGPWDRWGDVRTPQEHLDTVRTLLREFLPWEAARCEDIALTDEGGILTGAISPIVRHPVGTLPSGAQVLGLADAVVLNDPVSGQGSNNASKSAASYLSSILEHGDRPFDAAFMESTFGRFWDYAQYVTAITSALLAPQPPHVLELLGAAGGNPRIARRFVNGFDDPRDFFLWFTDPEATNAYLASMS